MVEISIRPHVYIKRMRKKSSSAELQKWTKMIVNALALCCLMAAVCVEATLKWPDQYSAGGTIYLPYAGIIEPFQAVVDMTNGMSSMDTYNGLQTSQTSSWTTAIDTYYTYHSDAVRGTAVVLNRADIGTYGTMFKTVPETTKSYTNKMVCFKIPGVDGGSVTAQGILPDPTLYSYVEDFKYNGINSAIYTSQFSVGNKNNNYTLIVNKDTGFPVLLTFKGYDRLLGSHYDQYTIVYDKFSATIDSSKFNVIVDNCISFPGPGDALAMAENPFFEFVGASGYDAKHQSHKVDREFQEFRKMHNRNYVDEKVETQKRFHFHQNHRYIHSMNRRDLSYKLKVNHMTDYSHEEIKRMRGYRHSKDSPRGETFVSTTKVEKIPSYYNWWLRGAVTPVKDQGICGSCWSFGTTGTIEGSYFIKHGNLVSLSEQALVDCSWGYGNNGCDGGESERAYQWIIDNGCIPNSDYGQYLMQDGYCNAEGAKSGAQVSKFYNTRSGDVADLVTAIYEKGPISVAIDASHKSFSFYSHGIYYEQDCGNGVDDLDHQVLAVGYGTLDDKSGQEFWMIKNSWSTYWGNDGYVLMSRKDNNCGVATDASYAELE